MGNIYFCRLVSPLMQLLMSLPLGLSFASTRNSTSIYCGAATVPIAGTFGSQAAPSG